jgi:hypothetical protein
VQYAVPSLKKKDTSEPSSPPHSIRSLSLAGDPHMLLAAHMAAKGRGGPSLGLGAALVSALVGVNQMN